MYEFGEILMHMMKQKPVKAVLVFFALLTTVVFAEEQNQQFYGLGEIEQGIVEVQLFHENKRYINLPDKGWVQRHFWSIKASVFGYLIECNDLRILHYFNSIIDRNVAQRYVFCVSDNSPYGLRVRFDFDFDYRSPDRSYGVLKPNIGYVEVYLKNIGHTKSGNYRNPNERLFDRFTMPDAHRLAKVNLQEEFSTFKD